MRALTFAGNDDSNGILKNESQTFPELYSKMKRGSRTRITYMPSTAPVIVCTISSCRAGLFLTHVGRLDI